MKNLKTFAAHFGATLNVDSKLLVENKQKFYLLNPVILKFLKKDFYYAGLYLGKNLNGTFIPSFNLLDLIAQNAKNRVVLKRKAAWLFICGRDITKKGITKFTGSKRKGYLALVLNEHGECLGYGKIFNVAGADDGIVVKNVFDVGDFLRRERLLSC